MQPFIFITHPTRVVFGAGSLPHVAREIEQLGARRALVRTLNFFPDIC